MYDKKAFGFRDERFKKKFGRFCTMYMKMRGTRAYDN